MEDKKSIAKKQGMIPYNIQIEQVHSTHLRILDELATLHERYWNIEFSALGPRLRFQEGK